MKTWLRRTLWALGGLAVAIQLVPYGRNHANPPVRAEPKWDAPQTRALAARACFDCHSNETRWPWYSHVAPMSWLVQRDVDRGRRHLNLSEWDRPSRHADDAAKEFESGAMPPQQYLLAHGEARLDPAERESFLRGLRATFDDEGGGGRRRRGKDR